MTKSTVSTIFCDEKMILMDEEQPIWKINSKWLQDVELKNLQ